MKNILWLPSWYPNKLQPYNGDFIERHARAASAFNKIKVLFVVKDAGCSLKGKYLIEEKKYNENCSATILYYPPFSRFKWIDALFSGMRYFIFFAELIRQHIRDHGRPDRIHVHVSGKAGVVAWYCKWRYKLNYVLSEQWSGFMPGAHPSYADESFIRKFFHRKAYRNAERVSAVSRQLAQQLQQKFNIEAPGVIPNIVDTTVFYPSHAEEKNSDAIFTFVHISDFNYQKNPEQIFEAAGLLKQMNTGPFRLVVFAPDEERVLALASAYFAGDVIQFRNYVPHNILAREISVSDTLILYSRFETFGCVVIEAMASGIPVLASDIPVMREIISGQTGIIVELNNPKLLAEKMRWMMENRNHFNKDEMAAIAKARYSFERIGHLFDQLYK